MQEIAGAGPCNAVSAFVQELSGAALQLGQNEAKITGETTVGAYKIGSRGIQGAGGRAAAPLTVSGPGNVSISNGINDITEISCSGLSGRQIATETFAGVGASAASVQVQDLTVQEKMETAGDLQARAIAAGAYEMTDGASAF